MIEDIDQIKTEGAIALRCMADLLGMQRGLTATEWLAQPPATRLEQLRAAENDFASKEKVS